MKMTPVLGSASPRRESILAGLFGPIRVVHPSVEETCLPSEGPEDASMRLSKEKSKAVLASLSTEGRMAPSLVITADTVVAIDGRVIGKPSGIDDAVRMISILSGKTHRVITGLTVAVERVSEPVSVTRAETTEVTFKKLDDDGIRRYLAMIDYMDKAGAYAFQEHGGLIVESFCGSATNIIGFPLRLFFSMVSGMGLAADVFAL